MKYLCLIYLDTKVMEALPPAEMNALNVGHLAYNEALRRSGHFVEAEALQAANSSAYLRIRSGKPVVTDGPFAETKEQVAGFYLIEARDMEEAASIASKFPSAHLGRVEVWPTRQLIVTE
jgi:hypothetical protein